MQKLYQKAGIQVHDLEVIDFNRAYSIQQDCVKKVMNGEEQHLLLCEHQPVLTLGRLASREHVLFSEEEIQRRGIEIIDIDRGGEVTLHSPGQLVVYPILDLNQYGKDLKHYMCILEQVAIDLLREFDILADRLAGKTGVWIGAQKIASVGIGVKKWISFHGLAININTDLNLFSLINPCGLDVSMTSIKEIKGHSIDMNLVKSIFINVFNRHF